MYFEKGEYKMNKKKLSAGLVASFIGALALTSCSQTATVTPKDNSLVELVGYNGETDKIEVKTDDLYGKYSHSTDGTKLYYDAILEALVRYEYPTLSEQPGTTLKKYKTLVAEAEAKVTSSKQTANENAASNGTSYAEEWDKILESHDCENEEDLKQYYLYDLEKTELTDKYFKENETELMDKYIGVDSDWKEVGEFDEAQSLFPYHILHVLVSLDASGTDYVRGTISESNATKLWTVVRKLIDKSYTFEGVASSDSDDPGSKAKFGDVGLMTTKTSFYNEFKLGIYAYDAILSKVNTETDTGDHPTDIIYKAFGLNKDAEVVVNTTSEKIEKEPVTKLIGNEMAKNVRTPIRPNGGESIPTVPYSVFKLISDHAKDEKITGATIEAGTAALPRNILYNQFLNFHSPFLITDEDFAFTGAIKEEDSYTLTHHDFTDKSSGLAIMNEKGEDNTNFVEMTIGGVKNKYLCDTNGNVIIGVRSSAGIHFMVMRKSIFYETNKAAGKDGQSLEDYYTTKVPGEEGYPSSGETYVNMQYTTDESYYKDRSDEIKNAVKSSDFDAAYDYRIYEDLLKFAGDKVKFFDEDENGNSVIKSNIEKYIELLRETSKESNDKSINEAWQSYLFTLSYQNEVRQMTGALVPTTCAFNFNSTNAKEWKEGGYCYVK